MDVIQVLAGRDASVNSLFSYLVLQFPLLGLRESDELWAFFLRPRAHPARAALCLRSGITASFSSSLQHPSAAAGPFIRVRHASTHHLKLGPAVILSLHPEGAGFFPWTQETVKVS